MAQVKLSALLSDLRGKLGGGTFQGNNGVLSLRNNNIGVNTKSSNKIKQQGQMKYLQNAWRDLTNEQRQLWNNFSIQAKISTGKNSTTFLNGQSIFLKFNYYRYAVGLSILSTPSMHRNNLTNVLFSLQLSAGVLMLKSDRLLIESNEFAFVQISAPVAENNNYKKSSVKSIRQLITNGNGWDITQSYLNAFGFLPNANDYVFIDVVICDYETGWLAFNGNYKISIERPLPYEILYNKFRMAFSSRQLTSRYSDKVIRICNSNNTLSGDIGTINGELDMSAVFAIIGSNQGYVTKYYDQSGGINNLLTDLYTDGAYITVADGINWHSLVKYNLTYNYDMLIDGKSCYSFSFNTTNEFFNNPLMTWLSSDDFYTVGNYALPEGFYLNDYLSNNNNEGVFSPDYITGVLTSKAVKVFNNYENTANDCINNKIVNDILYTGLMGERIKLDFESIGYNSETGNNAIDANVVDIVFYIDVVSIEESISVYL